MNRIFYLLSLSIFAGIVVMPGYGQQNTITARVIDTDGQGNMALEIDGNEYVAFTKATAANLQFRIDSLNAELSAAQRARIAVDSLNTKYKEANAAYVRAFQIQDSLVTQTRDLFEGYRELNRLYRRTYSEPWVTLSGGLGAVRERAGEDRDVLPVVLLGLSVRRLSLWGFVNLEQSGFIIGMNQPLRLF